MQKLLVISIFLSIICLTLSCVKQDEFSNTPTISFLGQTKNILSQGALMEDSLFVKFSFTDGDGDIGDDDNINVFLTDTRQNFASTFKIPNLIFTTCCLYDTNQAPCTPSTSQPTDEVIFTLQISDRAGNMSNIIELDPITIMCD